jgi:hypothetical protein
LINTVDLIVVEREREREMTASTISQHSAQIRTSSIASRTKNTRNRTLKTSKTSSSSSARIGRTSSSSLVRAEAEGVQQTATATTATTATVEKPEPALQSAVRFIYVRLIFFRPRFLSVLDNIS